MVVINDATAGTRSSFFRGFIRDCVERATVDTMVRTLRTFNVNSRFSWHHAEMVLCFEAYCDK